MPVVDSVMIRGQQSDDWEALYALWKRPDVLLNAVELPYSSEDAFRERLSNVSPSTHILVAETVTPSGRTMLAGAAWLEVGARRLRHCGELNLVIHPDHRGTAAEAALLDAALDLAENWLGLQRVKAVIFTADTHAAALYEQRGFVQEAVMQRYALRGGEYAAAALMARVSVESAAIVHPPEASESAPRQTPPDRLSISVRATEPDDWESFAVVRDCENVIYYTLQVPFLPREAVRERFENPPPGFYGVVAVDDQTDTVIGLLGLHVQNGRRAHSASLGMMVHDDYQSVGVGTALMQAAVNLAENWLNLSRIELQVHVDNAAGLALYRKFGFEIEGTLRAMSFRDGLYVDTYLMARIREDS